MLFPPPRRRRHAAGSHRYEPAIALRCSPGREPDDPRWPAREIDPPAPGSATPRAEETKGRKITAGCTRFLNNAWRLVRRKKIAAQVGPSATLSRALRDSRALSIAIYFSLRFPGLALGCLYANHRNRNPTTGVRISLGRTSPTLPGEKLCAVII